MRKLTLWFLLVAASAKPCGAQTIALTNSVGPDGARYLYEISLERASTLTPWDQRAMPDPPLSMSAARKAAETWLMNRNPQVGALDFSNLFLSRINPAGLPPGPCRLVGCWYYRVIYIPTVGGRRTLPLTVVLLTDGSIVDPRLDDRAAAAPVANGGAGRGGGVPGTGRATGPIDTGPIYRPGGDVTAPRVLQRVNTQYTDAALRAKVQGNVLLDVVINTDGSVGDVKVSRSLDSRFGLDEEAIKAAKQWRFAPGMRMGVPVRVLVTLEMTFSLR